MKQKSIDSFDGTRIVYQVWGAEGDSDHKRWLVVANGYGGSFWAWREVFAELSPTYRILIWDYRGFYNSDAPADRRNLRIEHNCQDLDRLLAAEAIDRAVLCGWSVGVQVVLEQYRRRPEVAEALILLNGSHGRVLHRSLDGRLAGLVLPTTGRLAARIPAGLSRAALRPLRTLCRSRAVVDLLSGLRLVHGKPASIPEAIQAVLDQDQAIYTTMALHADEHDTEDLLPHIQVPTLVTSGERDIVTRPAVGRHVASRIPGAVYFEFPRATHYAVMEVPKLVANRIHSFITEKLD